MILAGDIGGTNCRLVACADDGQLVAQQNYSSPAFPNFAAVLKKFLEGIGQSGQQFGIACFGLPGPVLAGRCRLTNLSWEVDAAELAAQLHIKRVFLLNDLAANAYGLATLKPEERFTLNPGQPISQGNIAILAPGTGLGEAGLIYAEGNPIAVATEGAHSDFGPTNDLEIELLQFARRRFKSVTYENLISGPGLALLYDFLRERSGQETPTWLTAEFSVKDRSAAISQAALAHRDAICTQALTLFVEILAAEAANLALKFLAVGGVYLGGGVSPKILPMLKEPLFLRRFTAKDKMAWLLPSIPVHVILNDRTALQGSIAYALRHF